MLQIGNINRALRVYDDTYRLSPNNTDLLLEYAGFIWDNAVRITHSTIVVDLELQLTLFTTLDLNQNDMLSCFLRYSDAYENRLT